MATISQQEFLKGGKKIQLVAPASENVGVPKEAEKPGFFSRVGEDLKKRGASIKQTFQDTASGKINPLETGIQTVGAFAGGINDIVGESVKSGVNALPQGVKDTAKDVGIKILKTPVGQAGLSAIEQGMDKYNEWKVQNPIGAKNLESVLNIASLFPIGKGGQIAKEGLEVGGQKAIELGGKAIDEIGAGAKNLAIKASEKVTPIEKGVETVLRTGEADKTLTKQTMANTLNKYTDQAEKAIVDYSQATPMELAGNEAEKALNVINSNLKKIGESKKAVTENLATKPVGRIVTDARQEMRNAIKSRTGSEFTKEGIQNVKGRISSISDPADVKLIKEVDDVLGSLDNKFPTFRKVDDAIDRIQDLLYKRSSNLTIPVNSNVESILKGVVKNLNDKLKKVGGSRYSELNDLYSSRIDIKDILNRALGVDANKGASLMKQLFSPNGTMPRKLFADIKEITGIDLVQEATLAKFAMENIGDVRQASLLEQVLKGAVPTSRSGLVQRAGEKILEKLQNPIKKAQSVINKRKY